MINIHECKDVVQQRISYVVQNNKYEINEPFYVHFNKTCFNEFLRKSNINPSAKKILLNKRFLEETTDCINFTHTIATYFLCLLTILHLEARNRSEEIK